ncbi:MAG: hypothetical protein CL946_03845 [Ectothiorhodospiraceae bacterium]|nr:hypothetical protein [Ectothiorhodospiraceae bacterium]
MKRYTLVALACLVCSIPATTLGQSYASAWSSHKDVPIVHALTRIVTEMPANDRYTVSRYLTKDSYRDSPRDSYSLAQYILRDWQNEVGQTVRLESTHYWDRGNSYTVTYDELYSRVEQLKRRAGIMDRYYAPIPEPTTFVPQNTFNETAYRAELIQFLTSRGLRKHWNTIPTSTLEFWQQQFLQVDYIDRVIK